MKPKRIVHKLEVKITGQDWLDDPKISKSLKNVVSNHIQLLAQLYGDPAIRGSIISSFEREGDDV